MFSCSHCGLIHGSKMASQKTITISRLDEASETFSCFRLSVCWILHESKTQRNHERLHKFASRPHKHPRIEGIEYGRLASVNWHQTHKAQPGTTNKVCAKKSPTDWLLAGRICPAKLHSAIWCSPCQRGRETSNGFSTKFCHLQAARLWGYATAILLES